MSKTQVLEIPSFSPSHEGYRIVFEKQECSREKTSLPQAEQKYFEELYGQVQEDPQKYTPALEELYKRQPQVPEIANLLTYAYLRLKKKKEAEELIEKTYRSHPDYLIAKINYADQSLRNNQPEHIPEIFNHIFDLHLLYPNSSSFHYAEFRGFHIVMGFYYLKMGQKDKAEECYQLAFQVDPLHPSVAALERALSKGSLLKKCLERLQKLAGISRMD